MILQLAPISSAILSLAWQGEPGMTYTIQSSGDMVAWETLPYVVEGKGSLETYYLERDAPGLFVRLKYDTDGDTDDNALPDSWEWQHFGCLGADPNADPDMDGVSTYQEWLNTTDPADYYDSEFPVIHLACGKEWLIPAGELSSNGISLLLCRPSGEPWGNAPVHISMESGDDALEVVGSHGSTASDSVTAWTDPMGRIHPSIESIHVRAPAAAGALDALVVRAGKAQDGIIIHSIGEAFGPPPRNLSRSTDATGRKIYRWTGDPGEAHSFRLEELDSGGNWAMVAEIPTNELSPPDPVDGTYLLTIGN